MKSIFTYLSLPFSASKNQKKAAFVALFGFFFTFSALAQTVCPVRSGVTNKTCGATSTSLALAFAPADCGSILNTIVYAEAGGGTFILTKAGGGSCTATGFFNVAASPCIVGNAFTLTFPSALVCSYTAGAAFALPVELIAFRGEASEKSTELIWATASERDNAFFAVERSADGVDFENIGRVEGFGHTDQVIEYRFSDRQPLAGQRFYRLRQVDFDGAETFSDIISVQRARMATVSISPNPASDFVRVDLGAFPEAKTGVLIITSATGQTVLRQPLDLEQPIFELSTAGLQGGFYILTISFDGEAPISRPPAVER